MATEESKVRVTAAEFMILMTGEFDPHLSGKVGDALAQELAKPEYAGMPPEQAWAKASRHLSLTSPAAFDFTNKDDAFLHKIAPVVFREDGQRTPGAEVVRKIQVDDIMIAAHDLGSKLNLTLTARDHGTAPLTARFSVPTKNPRRNPGDG